MKNLYRINAFSTMAWWIACSIFIWPLAAMALAVIVLPIGLALSAFQPRYYSPMYDAYGLFTVLIIAPIVGLVIGASMSHLQRWLLRTKLYWSADNWRKWTMIGGAIAAYAVLFMTYLMDKSYNSELSLIFAMPVFISIVSLFQYLSLRHAVKDAWLWVLGNMVAGLVFGGLLMSNQPSGYGADAELQQVAIFFLAPAALGAITGYVMLFLFEKKVLPMQPENVPLVDPDAPKSIWDDAI